jgi:hypothetical protein
VPQGLIVNYFNGLPEIRPAIPVIDPTGGSRAALPASFRALSREPE